MLQGTLDTEDFNGNPPMNHVLQGSQTINEDFASYFLIACSDKIKVENSVQILS